MKLPNKTLERKLFKSGYRLIYAIDEVGMGCLAGPVVVCAVAFERKFFNRKHKELNGLMESKLLSAKQREEYSRKLTIEKDMKFQVAYAYPRTIDKINIYQASRLAMRNAIKKLTTNDYELKTITLIDGNKKIPGLKGEQLAIVKGDRKIFAIACASIIAKVYRDKMMVKYAKKYPGYGFEKHKGYGTKYHQLRLASLGPCGIHRRSFRLEY